MDKNKTLYLLHRVVMNAPDGVKVDHINGDGLDNRKENLRMCTNSENAWNRRKNKDNTSGFTGVNWNKLKQRWMSRVQANGKRIHIGYFDSIEEAVTARDEVAKILHGEFVILNGFIESDNMSILKEKTWR